MPVEYIEKSKKYMKYFKKFVDFISEGAKYNDDKTQAIISFYPQENDWMDTTHAKSTKKQWIYPVFYGLEISPEQAKHLVTLKGGAVDKKTGLKSPKVSYQEKLESFMKLIKAGQFTMGKKDAVATGSDKLLKIDSTKDIGEINIAALFDFIRKNIDSLKSESRMKNLKYIIRAESAEPGSEIIAKALEFGTGAKIITLNKNEYNSPYDILKDQYKTSYNFNDVKELKDQIEQVLRTVPYTDTKGKLVNHKDNKGGSKDQLVQLFGRMSSRDSAYKMTTLDNHVRQFLKTKYNYDEEFIKAVQECSRASNQSKLIVVDDNFASGTDMREIFESCKHIINDQQSANDKLINKFEPAERNRVSNSLKVSNDNLFGFVMYKFSVK